MNFGLEENQQQIVRGVLNKYFPNCRVWVFGSRAVGSYKKFSDLDLAVETPNNPKIFAKALEELSESDLPIKVDLIAYLSVPPSWKESIDRDRVEFS